MKVVKYLLKSALVYFVLFEALIVSGSQVINAYELRYANNNEDYSQPALQPTANGWAVNSIDTQVVSAHWINVPKESIRQQITLLKNLGVNYVAIATPYDRVDELKNWTDEIHAQGLHVWFRSHWDSWEGDDNKPPTMTPQEYLDDTVTFIKQNPYLFQAGDSFTLAVEPEQEGIGLGKKFKDWDEYRKFLVNEIVYANQGFKQIGMENKIYTNWISVNGWVAQNEFTKDLVDKLGLITIDHYPGQDQTIGQLEDSNQLVNQETHDLDELYQQWHKPILLGEWGYQIYQEVSDDRQAEVIKDVLQAVKTRPYVIGFNYWAHMGHHSRIIGDENGANLSYRKAAYVLKAVFTNQPLPDQQPTPIPTP